MQSPPRAIFGVLLWSLVGACAARPAEEPPPPVLVTVDSFPGTILTGPVSEEPLLDHAPWSVDLLVTRVDELPDDVGDPLTSRVRHVFIEHSSEPLKTRSVLALGVRVAVDDDPLPDSVWEEHQLEALWPGMTVSWLTTHNAELEDAARVSWDAFEVKVSRSINAPERCELALSFEGWVTPAFVEDGQLSAEPVLRREHIALDPRLLAAASSSAGKALRVFLPAPRQGLPRAAEIIEIRVTNDPDSERPGFLAAVERGRTRLAARSVRARTGAEAFGEENEFHLERGRALAALERDALRRPALLFLAQATGAEPTGELALMADDDSLADFLLALQGSLVEMDATLDSARQFGWFMERATYRWLVQLAADPERTLSPELSSLLLRHTGELGRYPDLIVEAVNASSDQASIRSRFRAENRIFLEDSHPAARVRAYDWLRAKGLAPAGYDPLGSRAERRAALAALEEEQP